MGNYITLKKNSLAFSWPTKTVARYLTVPGAIFKFQQPLCYESLFHLSVFLVFLLDTFKMHVLSCLANCPFVGATGDINAGYTRTLATILYRLKPAWLWMYLWMINLKLSLNNCRHIDTVDMGLLVEKYVNGKIKAASLTCLLTGSNWQRTKATWSWSILDHRGGGLFRTNTQRKATEKETEENDHRTVCWSSERCRPRCSPWGNSR